MRLLKLYTTLSIVTACITQCSQEHLGETIFPNLYDTIEFSKVIPERPIPDTLDWKNVSFEKFFYERNHPKALDSLIYWLKYGQALEKIFINQVKKAGKTRQKAGFKGSFVRVVRYEPGSRFIIMANLYGSFHSLIRFLDYGSHHSMIDNDFTIKPPYFFIFDGNALTDSPYGLDTLALIMRLMEVNPDRIFFVRGSQEEKSRWLTSNLNTEIKQRITDYKKFEALLNRLIDTLPLALYLIGAKSKKSIDMVRICNFGLENRAFDENMVASLFLEPNRYSIHLDDQSPKYATIPVNIRAVIQGSKTLSKVGKGLELLPKENGTMIWASQSGSTGSLQVLNRFFYESFIILQTATELSDWTLTLYSHDIRKIGPLEEYAKFNLITGEQLFDKTIQKNVLRNYKDTRKHLLDQLHNVTQKEQTLKIALEEAKKYEELQRKLDIRKKQVQKSKSLNFGSTGDLSRSAHVQVEQIIAGIQLAFDAQNKLGGIHGLSLALTALDDQYSPDLAAQNAKKFINILNIDKLLAPYATPTLEAYLDLVREKKLLVLFPDTGGSTLRSRHYSYIINFRPSYTQEGEILAKYALTTLESKKIAILYQSDVISLTDGLINYFKKVGYKNYIEIPYARQATDFGVQIKQLLAFDPDTLIFLSVPTPTVELIRQIGATNIMDKHLLCWSQLTTELFDQFVHAHGLHFIKTNVVPNPTNSTLPLILDFTKKADAKKVRKDVKSLEGFIDASILIEILKKIEGPVTKEKIIEIAESFNNYDLGGIQLTFQPETRQLSTQIWLDTGTDTWQEISLLPMTTSTQQK